MKTGATLINKIAPKANDQGGGELVSFVNLYTYGILRRNPAAVNGINRFYLDGSLMVWCFRLLGHHITRQSFDMSSLAASVLSDANERQLKVAFIGGEEGVAERAVSVLQKQFPNLSGSKTCSGFFKDPEHRATQIERILAFKPDIIVAGMGAGAQEEMLIDLGSQGFDGQGYTCGGFLHQTAMGKLDYYPAWINRYGLRWLYRCIREPKVIKRVLVDYPVNGVRFFRDYRVWK